MSLNHSHFLQLFEESRDQDGVTSSHFSTLPIDLWYYIASLVKEKDDLIQLSRTSRTLYAICEQYLYRSITIYIEPYLLNTTRSNSLLMAMQNPRLADFVTCVVVYVRMANPPHQPELCGRLDEEAGRLVAPLRNLQDLTCYCDMSCEHSGNYFSYIQCLETRVLAKLHLSGEYFQRYPRTTSQIFSAPCMRGITSLDLGYHGNTSNIQADEQAVVDADSFPCLRELSSHTFRTFMTHIHKGSIPTICDHSDWSDLHNVLSNSLPGIMHLYQKSIQDLIPSIMGNPSPYLKLRAIGIFWFLESNDPREIVATLKGLSCLPRLSCIELCIMYPRQRSADDPLSYNDGANLALVQDIHKELRKLSRVYIECLRSYGDRYAFEGWELLNDVWRSKDLDYYEFTYQADVRSEYQAILGLE